MEWGATWIREWKGSITHVIVDKELCYEDLLSFLKVDALPVSDQDLSTRGLEWTLIAVGQGRPGQRNLSDRLHNLPNSGQPMPATVSCYW